MDDTRIFRKTPAGEEAVRDRAQLAQRSLRTVLIIVDGRADVAELKRKAGDASLVEAMLPELEGLGLIESVGAEPPVAAAEAAGASDEIVDIFGELAPAAAGGDLEVAEEEPARVRVLPGFVEPMAAVPEARKKEAPEPAAPRRKRSERRAETAPSIWPKRLRLRIGLPFVVGAAASAIFALLLVALLYPYGKYRPEIERRMSQAVQDTVKVGGVGVRFVPLPTIVLTEVAIGDDGYASAASVLLRPELASLIGGPMRLREVRVEGARIGQAGIGRAMRWLSAGAVRDLAIGRVTLDGVAVDFGQASLEGLSGEGTLDPEHGLVKWSLRNREGNIRLDAMPGQSGARLVISAAAWRMPFRPALLFDALTLEGTLAAGTFRFDRLDGRLYDGLVEGAGILAWGGDGARFEGDVEFKRLAADRLLTALSAEQGVAGAASGRLRLDARAVSLAGLAAAVRMSGSFDVAQGALGRIDLVEAMRAAGPIRGGETRFEQFSGSFAADERGLRLTELQLASGLMQASGQAAVDRNGGISGSGVVEMKSSAGGRRAAFAIGGKAADPELRPGR